jgi:hypothetical protein
MEEKARSHDILARKYLVLHRKDAESAKKIVVRGDNAKTRLSNSDQVTRNAVAS